MECTVCSISREERCTDDSEKIERSGNSVILFDLLSEESVCVISLLKMQRKKVRGVDKEIAE